MSPDRIKSILNARPFQSFRIHTGDGSTVDVKSPEFAYLYPGGRTLLIVSGTDEGQGRSEEHRIDVFLITKVTTPVPRNGRHVRRK